jgi:hypothetical protein
LTTITWNICIIEKVERYQRGNQKPLIEEGQDHTVAKLKEQKKTTAQKNNV